MAFKLVILWTDVALWGLALGLLANVWRVRRPASGRAANWARVFREPVAACSGLVLLLLLLLALLDSVHWRSQLPLNPAAAAHAPEAAPSAEAPEAAVYDTQTLSLLDVLLTRQREMRELSYSAPLAYRAYSKEPVAQGPDRPLDEGAELPRAYPRLLFGGAHLSQPEVEWAGDIAKRVAAGWAGAAVCLLGLLAGVLRQMSAAHGGWRSAWEDLWADRSDWPWRALLLCTTLLALVLGPTLALMDHYHVLGTDRTGNDVLYQTLKSVRTAFVIGILSTLASLPFALVLGVVAGYVGGWVDEAIQYLYTTLSSVPNVLMIAACVLMVQVFLDKHPELFVTGVERADVKMLMLCLILGLTGWAGLCRLVRAETLKLRELDYVQAAMAFGVSPVRIMARHIVPNVMHLVLIAGVLGFSELVLYEAVLTYVGVGVDPRMHSFGSMINLARTELSRDPWVWWNFGAAFVCMLSLVLAANLLADAVREGFDPRARSSRPRGPRAQKA